MRNKIMAVILVLVLAVISFAASGGYVPTPAPNPMGTFDVYSGEIFHGKFSLDDASGPTGMKIVIEPNELTITSSTVLDIAGYTGAKRYVYYFDYIPTVSKTITVKSYDSRNREVTNRIVFNVETDDLQVFTECSEVKESNEPVSKSQYFFWDLYDVKPQNEIPIIVGRIYMPHEILRRK